MVEPSLNFKINVFFSRLEIKGNTKDERIATLEKEIMKRKAMLHEIEATLPKRNSLYLKIILGNVNVSILNKNDKYVFLAKTLSYLFNYMYNKYLLYW